MSGADTKKKLVGRHKRVAFMDVAGDGKTYTRMTGFTSMSESKNARNRCCGLCPIKRL